ncbi:hypothetical protein [Actinokineospora terrae]|uniref:hypothetical protein n=1 Tax=Actinokineospora terrae TaxID=155974 RepID=UPI0015A65506|nr:hypothetical protein [Actinokineospora terrae]
MSLSFSSNISCVISALVLSMCTMAWMCTVRPRYQPGQMVVKRTMPWASVTWAPRR